MVALSNILAFLDPVNMSNSRCLSGHLVSTSMMHGFDLEPSNDASEVAALKVGVVGIGANWMLRTEAEVID